MYENLLSEKQIWVLKNAFCGKFQGKHCDIDTICRYWGFTDDVESVKGWIDHGTQTKPLYLVLIYEYIKGYEKDILDKMLYEYDKYRF